MTLREKAREWLKNYKAGDAYGGNVLSLEEMAAIVSEYLYETDPRKKAEGTSESGDSDSYREKYEKELADVKAKLNASELTRESLVYDLARARSKNEAYEFAIRCNSMSGAEVH